MILCSIYDVLKVNALYTLCEKTILNNFSLHAMTMLKLLYIVMTSVHCLCMWGLKAMEAGPAVLGSVIDQLKIY